MALLIFVFVAFFKMSEMGLLAFVAKMIRNNFFDVRRKFQTNYDKIDPLKVMIKKAKWSEEKQTIFEIKDKSFSEERLNQIDEWGLI